MKKVSTDGLYPSIAAAYSTITGHATLYWDTGWNDVVAKVSAGRYLAGDLGVTMDLSEVVAIAMVLGFLPGVLAGSLGASALPERPLATEDVVVAPLEDVFK